ncbi:SubName: Full=Uncharacterized protein {ECO:0000313/EMBL:CCA69610.1} [Serendipita indica DSM 11827]|nr:SubName: Full=Uncharacterized protein {ECO:0000313/EMBL:CCA69610.1} [Serendipita indica DSM 11827]
MDPLFHRPTPDEICLILGQIAENDERIAIIDNELKLLQQRRLHLANANASLRSRLAPVRRLTFDVLSLIFRHHVHIYDGDPWTLAHVSRTWRSAAFADRALWTGLHVQLCPILPSAPPENRRITGREYCSNITQLDLALRRASNHGLDVKIASPSAFPTVVRAHVVDMLHLISQHMGRWNSLEIEGSISRLPGLNASPPSNLERLTLKTRDTSLLQLINNSSINLKSLTSTQMDLSNFTAAIWLPTLRFLDITIPIDHRIPPQTEILKDILARAVLLEELTLDFHQMQLQVGELVRLPSLRKLQLYDIPQLLPFDCPNLTHLLVSVGKRRPILTTAPLPTPSKALYLPSLRSLTFQHPNLAAISAIVAPNLEQLVISPQVRVIAPQYNDNALRSIWSDEKRATGTMLSPRVLHLEDLHVSAETIRYLLGYLHGLENLTIKWVRTDHTVVLNSLVESISPAKGQGPDTTGKLARPTLCPSLQTLVIHDTSTLRSTDTKAMEAALLSIVSIRRQSGYPLKSVTCKWPQGCDMDEFKI